MTERLQAAVSPAPEASYDERPHTGARVVLFLALLVLAVVALSWYFGVHRAVWSFLRRLVLFFALLKLSPCRDRLLSCRQYYRVTGKRPPLPYSIASAVDTDLELSRAGGFGPPPLGPTRQQEDPRKIAPSDSDHS